MKTKLIPVLFLVLFMSACSSLTVSYDYDKTVDFNKYKTYSFYGWAEDSDQHITRFDRERLEQSFGAEFAKRGMTYVEKNGDAVVSLFINLSQKTGTTAYTNHYGGGGYGGYYGYGYGAPWGYGAGYSTTTYQEYDYVVGTLICDVFDSSTKQLVWQGVGSGTVNENANKREKGIPKTAAEIMRNYPITPIPVSK